jgi:hypothetical protein
MGVITQMVFFCDPINGPGAGGLMLMGTPGNPCQPLNIFAYSICGYTEETCTPLYTIAEVEQDMQFGPCITRPFFLYLFSA